MLTLSPVLMAPRQKKNAVSKRGASTTFQNPKETMRNTKKGPSRLRDPNMVPDDGAWRAGSLDLAHNHDFGSPVSQMETKHKRVYKACQRCRTKKIKCDGQFPCQKCKEVQVICSAGNLKNSEFRRRPKGYPEILETNHLCLIALVHKLYAMVRNGQHWDLGEPELNDSGLPVIHDIASRLGTIQPYSDNELPLQVRFPEDEAGMEELAQQVAYALQEAPSSPSDTSFDKIDAISAVPTAAYPNPSMWLGMILDRATELQGIISDQVMRLQQLHLEQKQLQQLLRLEQMQQMMLPGIGQNNFATESLLLPHSGSDLMGFVDSPVTSYNFEHDI